MLVSDIKRRVQTAIGDSSGILVTDVNILDFVNDAQLAINQEAELLRATTVINLVAGTRGYSVPADFISQYSLTYNYISDPKTLPNISRNEVFSRYPYMMASSERGVPVGYFVDGGQVNFFPVPSAAVACQLDYIKIPTAVAAVGNTPELPAQFHPLIARMIVALVKEVDEDYEAALAIKSEVFNELALLRSRIRQNDNSYAQIRDDSAGEFIYE